MAFRDKTKEAVLSHAIKMGCTLTQNFVQMSRLMSLHRHQEGILKDFTHMMRLSKGIRAGSQEDLKMV